MTDAKTQEQLDELSGRIKSLTNESDTLKKSIPVNLGSRLSKLENPPTPSPEKLKKMLETAGIPSSWLDKHANVSDQMLYASSQVVNFNPSAATIAPEALTVNSAGVSIAGVQVLDFFDSEKFRTRIRGILGRSQDLPVQHTLQTLGTRVRIHRSRLGAQSGILEKHREELGRHSEKLGQHSGQISRLATEVATMARVEAEQARWGARTADERAARRLQTSGSRERNQAEAGEMHGVADRLRDVERAAKSLANELA